MKTLPNPLTLTQLPTCRDRLPPETGGRVIVCGDCLMPVDHLRDRGGSRDLHDMERFSDDPVLALHSDGAFRAVSRERVC